MDWCRCTFFHPSANCCNTLVSCDTTLSFLLMFPFPWLSHHGPVQVHILPSVRKLLPHSRLLWHYTFFSLDVPFFKLIMDRCRCTSIHPAVRKLLPHPRLLWYHTFFSLNVPVSLAHHGPVQVHIHSPGRPQTAATPSSLVIPHFLFSECSRFLSSSWTGAGARSSTRPQTAATLVSCDTTLSFLLMFPFS